MSRLTNCSIILAYNSNIHCARIGISRRKIDLVLRAAFSFKKSSSSFCFCNTEDLSVGLHGGVKKISSSKVPLLCSLRKLSAKLSSTMVVVFKVFHTAVLIFFHCQRLTLLGRTKVSMVFSSPNPKKPKTNPMNPKTNPTKT
jgi:hypothetical protein